MEGRIRRSRAGFGQRMKTSDLTIVETSGSLVEQARQLGEAVRANYAATVALFEKRRPLLETAQGKQVLANVRRRYMKDCAVMLPYMTAFAEGVGETLDAVLEVNMLVMLSKSRLAECTGFIIAREGQTVAAQNWDTGESAAPMAVLEIGRGGNGNATARFTSALTLDFWAGVNPHGLATGGCSGPSGDPIGAGEGVTGTLWRGPVFYQCQTIGDVKKSLAAVPVPGKGFNTVYVDRHGAMLWTHQGAGRYGMLTPDTPYCSATGYRPTMNEPRTPKEHAEKNRRERFMALAAEASERDGDLVAAVKAILADHHVTDGHPDSAPCRHNGPNSSTQFSLVFDLSARVVHYCGQPCCNAWRQIGL